METYYQIINKIIDLYDSISSYKKDRNLNIGKYSSFKVILLDLAERVADAVHADSINWYCIMGDGEKLHINGKFVGPDNAIHTAIAFGNNIVLDEGQNVFNLSKCVSCKGMSQEEINRDMLDIINTFIPNKNRVEVIDKFKNILKRQDTLARVNNNDAPGYISRNLQKALANE